MACVVDAGGAGYCAAAGGCNAWLASFGQACVTGTASCATALDAGQCVPVAGGTSAAGYCTAACQTDGDCPSQLTQFGWTCDTAAGLCTRPSP
jgi:hypothetical protein